MTWKHILFIYNSSVVLGLSDCSNPKADEMDSDFTSVHLHHTKAMADAEKRTGSCRFDFMPCLQV